VPGFSAAAWQGVIAPGGTHKDILTKLNAELNAIVALDDVRSRMKDLGMIPVGKGSPDELQHFLESEIVRWAKVVEAAGLAGTE
jgi:tripartite-type tricarboxylate transporter receptor subunit TctC